MRKRTLPAVITLLMTLFACHGNAAGPDYKGKALARIYLALDPQGENEDIQSSVIRQAVTEGMDLNNALKTVLNDIKNHSDIDFCVKPTQLDGDPNHVHLLITAIKNGKSLTTVVATLDDTISVNQLPDPPTGVFYKMGESPMTKGNETNSE